MIPRLSLTSSFMWSNCFGFTIILHKILYLQDLWFARLLSCAHLLAYDSRLKLAKDQGVIMMLQTLLLPKAGYILDNIT
ncbi:unnamed protein product [Lathyrus oleraceus]